MDEVVTKGRPSRWWIGVGVVGVAVALVVAARLRPDWPWFSLWLFGLVSTLGLLSVPRIRRALGLSSVRVTLVMLTGVSLFNLFLFQVVTHLFGTIHHRVAATVFTQYQL